MTIQATALVHEAWMRLEREQKGWENRALFFAAAAEAMRRILIEQARRRVSEKRGAGVTHDPLTDSIEITASNEEIFAVHEALDALAADDTLKVIVITGAGDVFSAGFDLREFEQPELADRLWASSDRFHATVLRLLGIDHERLTYYHNGIQRRLTNVHGEVVTGILA